MKIIEIKALENGAHRNQTSDIAAIPEGWAVIPEDMVCENFPFGKVETAEVDGVVTVTKWTAGEIPEQEDPEAEPTEVEKLRADLEFLAIMTGVEL